MSPILAGGLSGPARSAIRGILVFEMIINAANGVVSLVSPRNAIESMTTLDLASGQELGLEAQRWFGAMGLVFGGFLLFRVLNKPAALRPLLEALLLGDVIYLGSLLPFAMRYGRLPLIVAPYALTLVMFVARAVLLLFEDWPHAEAEQLRGQQPAAAAPASGSLAPTAPDAPRVAGTKDSRRRSLSRVDRLLT